MSISKLRFGNRFWSSCHRFSMRGFATGGKIVHTPIVIVGGGPTGLMLSNLLSSYGTPSVLLEARSPEQIFEHPQAHFLNTRTMEILKHSLPKVYHEVIAQMPDVNQWKHFQWGSSMKSRGIARVLHPVDRPLQRNTDANGILLPSTGGTSENTGDGNSSISICPVGHLAQHHFCRILWEAAHQAHLQESHLGYGVQVKSVAEDLDMNSEFPVQVDTDDGVSYKTKVVVAADGSQSSLRKAWNISMNGQANIQNLINVHVKTSPELSKELYSDENSAMLHFIYNEEVVSVIVCHDRGELILQFPYFPPFQTLERNFSSNQVRRMVDAALGVSDTTEEELQVVSIRPWTMSALIAQSYVFGNRCVLAGDAAHVFPPAGGFGMNTGLQDVHNLAWRLSSLVNPRDHKQQCANDEDVRQVLQCYERERRPVAQQNAALSVRNYNRTLQLAKACYLNDQHPSALIALLSAPPLNFLPLETRQDMFQRLVKIAMRPLAFLEDTNIYGKHMINNVRAILERGEGLPLLFPKYELGYSCAKDSNGRSTTDISWADDTDGYTPEVRVGNLMPHVVMQVTSQDVKSTTDRYPNLHPLGDGSSSLLQITTTDLPSQVCQGPPSPCFVVVLLDCTSATPYVTEEDSAKVWTQYGIHLHTVKVYSGDVLSNNPPVSNRLILCDPQCTLRSMIPSHKDGAVSNQTLLLIRPDGVIARIEHIPSGSTETCSHLMLQGIREALGRDI